MINELKGITGKLQLYNDKVVLVRKGLMAKSTHGWAKGDKTIYIREITGIDFKQASLGLAGYIRFTIGGGNERTKQSFTQHNHDENALMFTKKHNNVAVEIKNKIEIIQQNLDRPANNFSTADELIKFNQLLKEGIISKDEFEKKKNELLSN